MGSRGAELLLTDASLLGWSGGIAFLTGVLNGAFTIGTPDAVSHMAEELPNPKVDLPKAVFAQIGLGFITTFCYAIAVFYAISDLEAVTQSTGAFPIAAVYSQATGSAGGTFGLLLIVFLSVMICTVGKQHLLNFAVLKCLKLTMSPIPTQVLS